MTKFSMSNTSDAGTLAMTAFLSFYSPIGVDMRDWSSPAEIQRDTFIFGKLTNVWVGIYVWEMLTTMQFERDYIVRKRCFQWPLIPYFLGRYSLLVALICCLYMIHSTRMFNCDMLYGVTLLLEMSVVSASISFALRTMAVWSNRIITGTLWALIALGTVLVILNTSQSKASWDYTVGGCIFLDQGKTYLTVTMVRVYTMIFDAIVLFLNAYKLGARFTVYGEGTIVQYLLAQGLAYFILARFLCNATAVGFLIWKPNFRLGVIACTPSSLFTVIAAGRCVRHLDTFMAQDSQEHFESSTDPVRYAGFTGPYSQQERATTRSTSLQ
ncbi:hypothetical protein CPB83DRAFT_861107 [Crepidotus variabilis]|uniref:Transmembrane protein n=1 Tax=Crepidotus variabilis TaxID=179855 RepID=A0A9P6E8X4_9AGAR|nr:hypothetical protein CPB83DRAFT_861107 [Crepidotus variabilis]